MAYEPLQDLDSSWSSGATIRVNDEAWCFTMWPAFASLLGMLASLGLDEHLLRA